MKDYQPWLGTCQFARAEAQTGGHTDGQTTHRAKSATSQDRLEGLAAAFCMDRAGYEAQVRAYGAARGLRLIWCEEVRPAGQWIARYPMHRDVGGSLARMVDLAPA